VDQITLTADLVELRRRITGLENFAAGAGYPGPADATAAAAAVQDRLAALERFEQRRSGTDKKKVKGPRWQNGKRSAKKATPAKRRGRRENPSTR
jgi:hypothetical protein